MIHDVCIREAVDADVPAIRNVFLEVYRKDYPYHGFLDEHWLKRSVYADDILMLVAEDAAGEVLGSASVIFDIGAHSDLCAEFGRLVVHPGARGRGVAKALMQKRVDLVETRLHVAVVENRCAHPYSQRVSHAFDFAPVGFLPNKHLFLGRESTALFARHFGVGLSLRCNHPRIVPEAHEIAHLSLHNCQLPSDAIIDEDSAPYPPGEDYVVEELTVEGLPTLLRIERGRVRRREVFGPMQLHYGFFKLTARRASYLIANQPPTGSNLGPVAAAVGYIRDPIENTVRIFELIMRDERAVSFLVQKLLLRCAQDWGVEYVEVDVSAYAPRMQRTLLELGFLPAAYVPAMVFHDVERLDVVKMVRLAKPADLGELVLTSASRTMCDAVMRNFRRQAVLPQISEAIGHMKLFDGLNAEQSTRVASACSVARIEMGSQLFAEGDAADRMFLIIDGDVTITLGDPPRELGTVTRGEVLGEVALLTREPHFATAVAEGSIVTAVMTRENLTGLTRQRPDIAVRVYRNLAVGLGHKLRRADSSMVDLDTV